MVCLACGRYAEDDGTCIKITINDEIELYHIQCVSELLTFISIARWLIVVVIPVTVSVFFISYCLFR